MSELSYALTTRLEHELTKARTFGKRISPSDRSRAERALADLYNRYERPAPAVVWCRSLYQLIILPSLLIGIVHSEVWQHYGLAFRWADDEELDRAWQEIWTRAGCLFMNGMRRSSRLSSHPPDVEVEAMIQAKGQLRLWSSSEAFQRFEDTKDDYYRRLWTRHTCDSDFFWREAQSFVNELSYELSREIRMSGYEGEQCEPFLEELSAQYRMLERSLKGLIATAGAEPATQLGKALFLPCGVPPVTSSKIFSSLLQREIFDAHGKQISVWLDLSSSILAMLCLDDVVFACEQPETLQIDSNGRLHSSEGPALSFSDGSSYFIWHGVNVEERIITEPESITVEEIDATRNLEVRRVLIEQYGQARYLTDSGCEVIDEDEFGILYKKEIPSDEPIVMVKVVNSTAEPDGSFREYFLRVPPEIETAKAGIAWTFGLDEDEYQLEQET